MESKENNLDKLIELANSELDELTFDQTHNYVTHYDLRSIDAYKDKSIMAVKAPDDATLHVPHIDEYGQPKVCNLSFAK